MKKRCLAASLFISCVRCVREIGERARRVLCGLATPAALAVAEKKRNPFSRRTIHVVNQMRVCARFRRLAAPCHSGQCFEHQGHLRVRQASRRVSVPSSSPYMSTRSSGWSFVCRNSSMCSAFHLSSRTVSPSNPSASLMTSTGFLPCTYSISRTSPKAAALLSMKSLMAG